MVDSRWFRASVWLVTLLMVAVWLAMLLVTMPHLETLTGGLKIFDMRPLGYTFDEAETLLTRLGYDGRIDYQYDQQTLDTFLPALVFLTVSGWQIVLARKLAAINTRLPNWLMAVLIIVNLIGAMADYGENGAVRQMLVAGPDALSQQMVDAASGMTLAKSLLNTLSYMLLLAMALVYFVGRRARRVR
jgi:hypothetical protein